MAMETRDGFGPKTVGLPSVERTVALFSRFPGIGQKSAQRLVYHLIRHGRDDVGQLVQALQTLSERVGHCARCHNLAESDLCWICDDPRRDAALLCVLEEPMDLLAVERAGFFRGLYHVLGGRLNPLGGMGPEDLTLVALEGRLREEPIEELIIATNSTVEGEATAHYLAHMARGQVRRVTRLAHGVPMGGELEYLDESTVYQALAGRRDFS